MTTPAYATLDETATTARRAADDLAAIREQWGDLLDAIGRRPAAEWPPRECREFDLPTGEDDSAEDAPSTGRLPLTLREHPAPLNLDALDAALDAERELFDLADTLAAAVQRPIRHWIGLRGSLDRDQDDAADPARWHYQAPTSPGSRAYGLHWAAVWVEGRVMNEDVAASTLFTPVPLRLLDQAAATARRVRTSIERALGRDGRTTTLDTPCPWCGGELAGRTRSGGEPSVTCSTGEGCGAPVPLDRGRRTWRGADLVALYFALQIHSDTE